MAVKYTGSVVRFGGRNPATTTGETNISDLGLGITYAGIAAAKLQVSSSSADDDGSPAGTGAQIVRVQGLDANYNILVEDITLNGQTQVESAGTFLRVFDAQVLMAGSGYINAGDIYVIKTGTGGTVTAGVPGTLTSAYVKILAGKGRGTSGMFTVPLGRKFVIRSVILSGYKQSSEILIYTHNPTSTTENALSAGLTYSINSSMQQFVVTEFKNKDVDYPITFPEKTDIYLRVISSSANGVVSAAMILEDYFH